MSHDYTGMPAWAMIYFEMNHPYRIIGEDVPVWVIGDVHGCTDQYCRILQRIINDNEHAAIFQLGDLIDRGPGLREVILLSEVYQVTSLIGNHELNFLQEHFGYKQCRSHARRVNHDRLASYSEEDRQRVIDYMLGMENVLDIDLGRGVLWQLSHSPTKNHSVEYDCGNASMYCMINKSYENRYMGINAAHGHQHWNYTDIEEQIADPEQDWYNVDGGCCYGGELIALELNTLRVFREKNDIDYSKE